MPTYEYECQKCGHHFDVWQSAKEEPLTKCTVKGCRGSVRKVFHPVGIIFKGSGWHITDYGRNGNSAKGKGTQGAAETSAKSDTEKGASKAKSEAATAPKSSSDD